MEDMSEPPGNSVALFHTANGVDTQFSLVKKHWYGTYECAQHACYLVDLRSVKTLKIDHSAHTHTVGHTVVAVRGFVRGACQTETCLLSSTSLFNRVFHQ